MPAFTAGLVEQRRSKTEMLGFFLVEFVALFVVLELFQLAGLGSFAPLVAGLTGGLAAMFGTAIFWGFRHRTEG